MITKFVTTAIRLGQTQDNFKMPKRITRKGNKLKKKIHNTRLKKGLKENPDQLQYQKFSSVALNTNQAALSLTP